MNEDRLRGLLHEEPIPGAEEAERRGLALIRAAYAERRAEERRPRLPRLAVAFAAITLLAGLLLSPAGATVRDWVDDAFTAGVQDAEPALTDVPGGGRLLVQSSSGPWVVQPDGSRRLLGSYGEATWSPHGLFVAATGWRTLSAVEPGGTVRWALSAAPPVTMPSWSPSGVRIAYRAGRTLRVVVGNGDGDAQLDRDIAPLPAVWAPQGPHLLAYVKAGDTLRIANADSGKVLTSTPAQPGIEALDWSADGSQILEATRGSLWVREVAFNKLSGGPDLGPPRRLPLPPGVAIQSASFSPEDRTVATLLALPSREDRPARSEVVLADPDGGPPRPLFTAPGRLSDLDWSPTGSHLLIGWPRADQWLFVPVGGVGRERAVGGIATTFDPGESTSEGFFPRVEGWCCPASAETP
jgi:dipeptidyl aminopeptidase/acylaminoacyl peptidase